MPAQTKPTVVTDDGSKPEPSEKEGADEDTSKKDVDEITLTVNKELAAEAKKNMYQMKGLSRSVEDAYTRLRRHEGGWITDCVNSEDQEKFKAMIKEIPNPPVKTADKKAYKAFYDAMKLYTDRILQEQEPNKWDLKVEYEGFGDKKGLMEQVKDEIRKLKRQEIMLQVKPTVM
jgi:hypothetical protein